MHRFAFDTVLVALNAADVHRLPFVSTVVAEAARQNMGVIAMKVCAQKRLLARLTMAEALGYVWSIPGVSLAIVGCETPEEVDENANLARGFQPFSAEAMRNWKAARAGKHRHSATSNDLFTCHREAEAPAEPWSERFSRVRGSAEPRPPYRRQIANRNPWVFGLTSLAVRCNLSIPPA